MRRDGRGFKAHAWKACIRGNSFVGSNPTLSAKKIKKI